MPSNRSSNRPGRPGARALTGAGLGVVAMVAAFASLRGGYFARGVQASVLPRTVTADALLDGIIDVPAEAASFQAALDFASDGSTVRLAPGTYTGPFRCDGKSIAVAGAGRGETVIRGFGAGPVMAFSGDSTVQVRLAGFSVVDGQGDAGCGLRLDGVRIDARDLRFAGNRGGGVVGGSASGAFRGCEFDGNSGPRSGGAADLDGGNVTFVDCTFRGNVAATFGGAVYGRGGTVSLLACTVEDNSTRSGAWGGAVFGEDAVLELHGTDFSRNRAIESGGAVYLLRGIADVSRCSFTGNQSGEARSIFSRGAGVRLSTSRLCGVQSSAIGGDLSPENDNVFDAACQGDCNQNGVADAEEISLGWSPDRDGNGVPDACDPDCNANGLPDGYEIAAGFAGDANLNGMIDACEIRSGLALDRDNDGIPDDAQQASAAAGIAVPAAAAVPAPAPEIDPYQFSGPGGLARHMDFAGSR